MMFVDAVRRYVDSLPDQSTGWLAGLRDRHVGRAFARAFKRFVGMPPAAWRRRQNDPATQG